jgi:SAM-dependent methyltransferase
MSIPKWPKRLAALSPEQMRIRDDFMRHWLEVLPNRFGLIEQFNHRYPLRTFQTNARTLEIGAGLGAHLRFENLPAQEYWALELRPELARALAEKFPGVQAIAGDCQQRIDLPDHSVDRALAIHVLEHLPNLPAALLEIKRVLKPGGTLCAMIPCDPGLAYSLARNLSARRIFEKRYHQSYDWLIQSEHINSPAEILAALDEHFFIADQMYFPLLLPLKDLNLVIGITLRPKF